jgi:hypothetical protein
MVNTITSKWTTFAVERAATDDYGGDASYLAEAQDDNYIGCVWIRHPSTHTGNPIIVSSSVAGSQIYIAGCQVRSNFTTIQSTNQWGMVTPGTRTQAGSPLGLDPGISAAPAADALAIVQSFAGARSGERALTAQAHERQIWSEITAGNPTYKTTATVTVPTYATGSTGFPASPPSGGSWSDVMSSGYTRLEEYLHDLEDAVL